VKIKELSKVIFKVTIINDKLTAMQKYWRINEKLGLMY